ncbi:MULTISPECIES: 4-hydroxyphenylpyruvate dioxygenase [unclassified Halomonas]|uniref:4-hydroxyphenylpyruvate dioxygenase n=1 Tax=unclassified Halomonas TaxID=2609666 RepID=UPI000C8B072C|nr:MULTISPECIES: 4-hydroxyphenylpyruvate dioxygenase [unclassified Halomonas]MAR73363.1 4-hydroxyphenylpyruvate dioxygenase [Halomonas sp.]MCJ8287599.1 4-hydroxyphenylpyruvate dioxygenase [Halomonas sp.]MCO7216052.1 4-hydroxyphenylpyruvate dioxygenase [Halomonas sp. OfavH-34-E]NQY72320.1 4-hydroxyphenylpyruvate dioxygenase [Halomonas sp.]RQW69761.1 4-hydroxyphenylpyruvate dioxygenase [Halomonas sp. YLB-10]
MTAVAPIDTHNPIGTNGFEFVEYSAPDQAGIDALRELFLAMGFTETRRHRSKRVTLFQQEGVNFVLNAEPGSHAAKFAEIHGPGACAMAWKVADARQALSYAIDQGARQVDNPVGAGEVGIPAVEGIGGSLLYFVDDRVDEQGRTIYDIDFEPIAGTSAQDNSVGLKVLDHLTHNVARGQMDPWADFYTRIANFRENRYFDIEGKKTGLHSRAMTAPCGKMHIPINESADDNSQIAEFIREYNGEGIQHLAMATDDIYATVRALKANGIRFLSTPDTYYEKVNVRVPNHEERVEDLRELSLLIDGGPDQGVLLQIFTETVIGPIFFEIIQRKGNDGFGEGNFKALFESIEEDQIRRGVLDAD